MIIKEYFAIVDRTFYIIIFLLYLFRNYDYVLVIRNIIFVISVIVKVWLLCLRIENLIDVIKESKVKWYWYYKKAIIGYFELSR